MYYDEVILYKMDVLTIKEKLALASIIEKNGNNWQTISKLVKPYSEQGRPNDWLNPKQCSQQFEVLETLVDIKDIQWRKKNGENITFEHEIVKILNEKRQEELMNLIEEETKKYLKLKHEIYLLENDQLDYNQLQVMLHDMELQEKVGNPSKMLQTISTSENASNNFDIIPQPNETETDSIIITESPFLSHDKVKAIPKDPKSYQGSPQKRLDSSALRTTPPASPSRPAFGATAHDSDDVDEMEEEEEEEDAGMSANILNALNKVEQEVVEMQDRERQLKEATSIAKAKMAERERAEKGSRPEIKPDVAGPVFIQIDAKVNDNSQNSLPLSPPKSKVAQTTEDGVDGSIVTLYTPPSPAKKVGLANELKVLESDGDRNEVAERGYHPLSPTPDVSNPEPLVEEPDLWRTAVMVEPVSTEATADPGEFDPKGPSSPGGFEEVKPRRGRKKRLKSHPFNQPSEGVAEVLLTGEIGKVDQSASVDVSESKHDHETGVGPASQSRDDQNGEIPARPSQGRPSDQIDKATISEEQTTLETTLDRGDIVCDPLAFIKKATRIDDVNNKASPKPTDTLVPKSKQPLVVDLVRLEPHSAEHKTWKRSIMLLHNRICSHNWSDNFFHPITDQIAPCYSSIIYYPTDLGTLKKWVENGRVRTTDEYRRWVMLMFQNALMYNSEDHMIYKMTRETYKDALKNINEFMAASTTTSSSATPTGIKASGFGVGGQGSGGGRTPSKAAPYVPHHPPSNEADKLVAIAEPSPHDIHSSKKPSASAPLGNADGSIPNTTPRVNVRNRVATRQKKVSTMDNRSEDSRSPR